MNYFEAVDLFAHLSQEDQYNLSDFCQLQNITSGEILFHEGDEPQALYLIKSGRLLIQKLIDGHQKNIALLGEGDLVGEMAFFENPPRRNATVRADIDSTLITILHFSMQEMMSKYPDLYQEVRTIIEKRSSS